MLGLDAIGRSDAGNADLAVLSAPNTIGDAPAESIIRGAFCFVPVDDADLASPASPIPLGVEYGSSASRMETIHFFETSNLPGSALTSFDQGSSCSSQAEPDDMTSPTEQSGDVLERSQVRTHPATTGPRSIAKTRKTSRVTKPLVPSRFCHICWRSSTTVRMVVCTNIHIRRCRKVECEKCFENRHAADEFLHASLPESSWQCSHCRGVCPERAQCAVYKRTNLRRRMQQKEEARKQLAAQKPLQPLTLL
mmetsp:Transcript_5155/g.12601  ORF Transcript_5155/g.12601 Transcript_5155/m.12601 type:complete len:251 (-) Transcript_5155:143-895(-)